MPGCDSVASTRTSRAKRSAGDAPSRSTLSATSAPSARSRARKTIPIPPSPTGVISWKRPPTRSPVCIGSLETHQDGVAFHALPLLDLDAGDLRRGRRAELVLHLHRLDDHERLPHLDRVA